jgi:hypothetical protein
VIRILRPDEWRVLAKLAYARVFGEGLEGGDEAISYAGLVVDDRTDTPQFYATVRELGESTLFVLFLGAFPSARNTRMAYAGFCALRDWALARYERLTGLIAHTNRPMLKLAAQAGGRIIGMRYASPTLLLEMVFERDALGLGQQDRAPRKLRSPSPRGPLELEVLDRAAWAREGTQLHGLAGARYNPTDPNHVDQVALVREGGAPIGYFTLRVSGPERASLGLNPGPGLTDPIRSSGAMRKLTAWAGERYRQLSWTLVNTDRPALRMAAGAGFRVEGIRLLEGRALLENVWTRP